MRSVYHPGDTQGSWNDCPCGVVVWCSEISSWHATHASLPTYATSRSAFWNLGAGSSSLPLLGGLAANATDSLAAPFVLGTAILLAGLGVTATLLARR